jgi:hypothetical protein
MKACPIKVFVSIVVRCNPKARDRRLEGMSATSVRLLQVAAEIVGGEAALAGVLGIGDTLLAKFMADRLELPDTLLLRAVDIILADRQARLFGAAQPVAHAASDVTFQPPS